jgi:hypothetical protein
MLINVNVIRTSLEPGCWSLELRRQRFSIDVIRRRFRLRHMIKSGSTPRLPAIGQKMQSLVRLKWLLSLVIAVVVTVAATPPPDQQSPDEQYIRIMALIDRGDALRAAGQMDAAKAKYQDAQKALLYFKATNPLFAPKTVTYRLNELNGRLETRPVVTEPAASAAKPKAKLEAESGALKTEVKLIDAGAEPRKVLRFHVTPGDKQSAIMTIKTSMEMPGGATAPGAAAPAAPIKIPAITVSMDISILNIETNGDVTYDSVIGDATVAEDPGAMPQMVQAMKSVMGGLKGLTTSGVVSSRGINKKVDVKVPPGADMQTRQIAETIKSSVSDPSIPLPEEAIGGGAKWEVSMQVKALGTTIDQTATFQLVSVDGDHLKATFTRTVGAGNAKAATLGMGNATGTIDADLSKLFASGATVDTHIETPGNKQQPAGLKMDQNVMIEAK